MMCRMQLPVQTEIVFNTTEIILIDVASSEMLFLKHFCNYFE